jgi:hypothetical protein
MSNRKKIVRCLSLVLLLFCFRAGWAHQPDLSSLMIYEQNGKSILLIKSSLTAFEQEMVYHYGKDSYKTPQEFQQLVIKHFQKNCAVIINGTAIQFVSPQVILGHETTVVAELSNRPKTIKSVYLKNTLFKDMPNNICEVILTLNNLPQKQFILGSNLYLDVKLNVENGRWTNEGTGTDLYKKPAFILLLIVLIFVSFALIRGSIQSVSSASFEYLFSHLLKQRR